MASPARPGGLDKFTHDFVTYLQRKRTTKGASSLARQTVLTFRDIITQRRWGSASELMDILRTAGKALDSGRPGESVVGNMVKRILRLVREAYASCVQEQHGEGIATIPSLHDMLISPEKTAAAAPDYKTPFKALKGNIVQAVNDLLEELEESKHNIAIQALEHIHADEVIMTAGYSRTVEGFLKEAGRLRQFHVIVAESAPSFQGQELAVSLGSAGIETTLITDSAIFAMMSRVNKVIIGTSVVMADGGLMAMNGCHALAMAAKHHSVPVIVCAGMFKLCPRYLISYDQDAFNNLDSPTTITEYKNGAVVEGGHCYQPMFDYVPPDLVNLIVSNIGGNAPSYLYRLLGEYYHEDDIREV